MSLNIRVGLLETGDPRIRVRPDLKKPTIRLHRLLRVLFGGIDGLLGVIEGLRLLVQGVADGAASRRLKTERFVIIRYRYIALCRSDFK